MSNRRHPVAARVALAVLLASVAACAPDRATAPEPAPSLAIAPTAAGVYTGVSIDGAPLGRSGMTAWDAWSTRVGKRPRIIAWYADWSTGFQGFALTNAARRR